MKKLVIIGAGATADLAFEYFQKDSPFDVVGFSVNKQYLDEDQKFGYPVVPLEELEIHFSSRETACFVAITFSKLNRTRKKLGDEVKRKGFKLASYISSKAFVWDNVSIGEHVFILEDNTIQPFATIGDGTTLWSGNHIGHHSQVGSCCFISSHVVVSGFCKVDDYSFLGVNTTLGDGVSVAKDNWIGPGITITKSTEPNQIYGPVEGVPSKVPAKKFFRIQGGD